MDPSIQPEDLSGILFILELKRDVAHRQGVLSLNFVDRSFQVLARQELLGETGAKTVSLPGLLVIAGPVITQE